MTVVSATPAESTVEPGSGPVLRLRPSVHASPTPDGIHVRGWGAAFTAEGGADLWRLWQRLEPALLRGIAPEQLDTLGTRPAVQRAVRRLVDALREHDMTMAVPMGWSSGGTDAPPGAVAAWLEAIAPDPGLAWLRIRRRTVTVHGTGPVADAAVRALSATGVRALSATGVRALSATGVRALSATDPGPLGATDPGPLGATDPGPLGVRGPAGPRSAPAGDRRVVRLIVDGTIAVAAGAGDDKGFVSAPASADEAARDATRIADRLGIAATSRVSEMMAALVGGAAAHRFACWAAGLPDPAREAARLAAERTDADHTSRAGAVWPAVLVARTAPPATAYHPWLLGVVGPDNADTGPDDGAGADAGENTLDDAVRRLDALCDDELGVLPPAQPGELPQLPVALATCRTSSRLAVGIGTTTGAARLDAALRAAAWSLDPVGTGRLAVGADGRHADGILLRRVAFELLGRCAVAAAPDTGWPADPIARRWWTSLTLRFGVAARGRVVRLADGVFAALVQVANRELGWAVEATPGDAAAFAAFHASAATQMRRVGLDSDGGPPTACGGAPAQTPPYGGAGTWMTGPWLWPDTRPAEERLQRALRRIVPATRHPRPVPAPHSGDLWDGLRAAGFAVREVRR
jgi:hypothetical protein